MNQHPTLKYYIAKCDNLLKQSDDAVYTYSYRDTMAKIFDQFNRIKMNVTAYAVEHDLQSPIVIDDVRIDFDSKNPTRVTFSFDS